MRVPKLPSMRLPKRPSMRLLKRPSMRLPKRPSMRLPKLRSIRLPTRLSARLPSLPSGKRRLGRGPLAVVLLLVAASTALGMSAASSGGAPELPSGPTVVGQAWSATAALVAERSGGGPRRGGAAYYRRTARGPVPAGAAGKFMPLYREAEREYGVNWRLIASIHRQETAFSTAPTTYRGLNDFGCCAGPMQFNVTNGPVSTWESYRHAYRDGRRPKRYPHRTRSHPSIYDDFDAIMAAGKLLSDSGAGHLLDFGAWWAAYGYYGHDLYGVTYANEVLARAEAWQHDGFCPNCTLDEGLVADFEDLYGASVRQQLMDAEGAPKKRKRHKLGRDRNADGRDRDKRRARERRPRRSPGQHRRPSRPPQAKRDRPADPYPREDGPATLPAPTTPATPPTTAPAPECPLIRKLLGCKPSP